jgi:hypothetical protein
MRPLPILLLTLLASAAPARAEIMAAPIVLVPSGSPTLSAAIAAVPDGGIIEMAAGTYTAPTGGFSISNPNKRFTIRAAAGATVILTGNNAQPVLRYNVTNFAQRGHVIFEDLIIRNGRAAADAVAGGFTVNGGAQAVFRRCTFENNTCVAPNTGGGGGAVFGGSKAIFQDCIFQNNTARNEGGGLRVADSEAWIDNTQFLGNSCAIPNHRNTAAGGGIHIGNGKVWVTNSRFEGNRAGYVGGALYAIGGWTEPVTTPRAEMIVSNCTFVDNVADNDPTVTPPAPSEGGAVHAEDQATFKIYNSRFIENDADNGGALSLYRALGEVYASSFFGNRQLAAGGFGGAVQAISRDTTVDGANNRRTTSLTVADSFFQGRYGTVTTVGEEGGAIFIEGDGNRAWGLNSVTQMGTVASNRATLNIDNTVFYNLDVTAGSGGAGGALAIVHSTANITDSLFIGNDALGTGGGGGALRSVIGAATTVTDSTFVGNTATLFGAAVYTQGAEFNADGVQFIKNEISPGTSEAVNASFGAAIFSAVIESLFGSTFNATGTVQNSLFSQQIGLPIFDDDRNGPAAWNDMRYNANEFFNTTFGTTIYYDSLVGGKTVAELNSLIVTRTNAPSTDKSPASNNSSLGSAPNAGALLATPPAILSTTAAGDPTTTTESFLAYAWGGSSATLDGTNLPNAFGVVSGTAAVHTLDVGGTDFLATIALGPIPTATLAFSPPFISGGGTSTLSWATNAGTFIASAIDQQVVTNSTASGSTSVTANFTRPYTLMVVTQQGGVIDETTLFVDEIPGFIFENGFESGNTSAWSSTNP